jgi:hypothetical protein
MVQGGTDPSGFILKIAPEHLSRQKFFPKILLYLLPIKWIATRRIVMVKVNKNK